MRSQQPRAATWLIAARMVPAAILAVVAVAPLAALPTELRDPGPTTPADRLRVLLKEHDAPVKDTVNTPEKAASAGTAFLAFADEYPRDPAALEALAWVATHCLYRAEAADAMGRIARDHAGSRDLAPVLRRLDQFYGGPFPPQEKMLRHVLAKSPHRDARAEAALALAHELRAAGERLHREHAEFALAPKGPPGALYQRPDGTYGVYPAGPPAGDPAKALAEVETAYESLAKEFGDLKRGDRTFGDVARTERLLLPGKVAPDIAGADADGNRFKLSDHRGKVVVLTFTTTGCAPCRKLYAELRVLAKRFEGKPLVILSVYATEEAEDVRKACRAGDITWRCWWDRGGYGPICSNWGVEGFPQAYILDAEGVVRFKGEEATSLTRVAESLLRVAERPGK